LSRQWIITDESILRLVDKAHVILNAPQLDLAFLQGTLKIVFTEGSLASLLLVLESFRAARSARDAQEAAERSSKRVNRGKENTGRSDPFEVRSWRVQGYAHQW
jgi:hypothetical protein